MQSNIIDKVYIDGEFVTPHGTELFDLYNPARGEVIGQVQLADEVDAQAAIAAAKRALPAWSATSKEERIDALKRLQAAVTAHRDELLEAVILEYGAPLKLANITDATIGAFADMIQTLEEFDFTRQIGRATVELAPVGVAGLITPWNADAFIVSDKLATALAAGCTVVVKPSEMSATQTHVLTRALHEAGLPKGVLNIVTGRGDVVGSVINRHPDVAKISFTGSTATGKVIASEAVDTLKRLTLELGGKSPSIILDDADLEEAIPGALQAGFWNSGQACVAGTRILVPESRLDEALTLIAKKVAEEWPAGDPRNPATAIGPMVSERQWERVQSYIRRGIEEGARVIVGGPGRPDGLQNGYFVRPTVFADVTNDMTIAREEIFGPVLSVITYRDDDHAIEIANDTTYGLHAYVFGSDAQRARRIASRIEAGRVSVNGGFENRSPFGGFKQSGIGREYGVYGLEGFLEPRSVMV
ncbi:MULTISPECIES: aldehyde dehydrogenase family protein [unclassified Streptomyces]|uniref:aldehyde dehydrogenase family protein n=1 Tax=unclassified Streptomyces TaxID=2593676 RepID=UPI0004C47B2C|nr:MULTISPECIES: aldehyde dehydrogenase family protein [unclassified Streptomyces]KOV77889.1 aldehyde dehydrogenase [Streptomyces sp. NRRL WC-3723]